uniref:Cadherin domain-containing protein n=1 Tax=Oryzias melastigma TaxID=30732 RepID=A0A3B3BDQ3_ORYME
MGSVWVTGFVALTVLQMAVVSTAEESSCRPGFESESLIFKVNRKHLKPGTRLGKGMLTSSTVSASCFLKVVELILKFSLYLMFKVQRGVDLVEGHQDFFVHSWDSEGNKMTVPVMVLQRGHHHVSRDAEQHHGDEVVLYFPKTNKGLRRRKRSLLPINHHENYNGPFPFRIVQIRTSEDRIKKITYSITGPGADEDPKGVFTMDKDTGELYVHQRLDREKQAYYTLMAHVTEAGSGEEKDPLEITINVIDMNDNIPIFEQTSYVGEVAESSPRGTTVVQVIATDADEPGNDNSIIKYTILSQEPKLPNDKMFAINTFNGAIMVEDAGLDRETYPEYTLEIQAADLRGEGFTGKTKVVLKVTDSNDNAPVFTESTGSVDENAVGVQIVKLSVTDKDEQNTPAWNAKFKIISGDPEKLFSIETGSNKHEGIIKTAQGLDFEKSRTHTLSVIVENDVPFAVEVTTSTATVVVTVKDVNEPPVFKDQQMFVQKPEDLPVNSVITNCEAKYPDFARENTVKYKIGSDPAGWLNVDENTGQVTVKRLMDRESAFVKNDTYTALIIAYEDVPATGTGTLSITLEDVNDNPPFIEERNITVCRDDSTPVLLTVADKDGPRHSAPYNVMVHEISKPNWSVQMNRDSMSVFIRLKMNFFGLAIILLWFVTERTRSRLQAAEMSFLRRVAGHSLRDRVRSSVTRRELGVGPLLLRIERSQLRWLGHLIQMPPGRLPGEVFRACPTGRRPRGRPRTRWRDYVSRLAWKCLGVPPEELEEVGGEREVWASLLDCCPRDPVPDKRKKMDGWMV